MEFLVILSLFLVMEVSSALYFHIAEGERKCFIEEIPDNTTVIVNYKVELYDPRSGGFIQSTPGISMHVELRDPNDHVLLSRLYSSEGMITWTSIMPGKHVICMHSNSTSWFSGSQLRVHFDIQTGEPTEDVDVDIADKLKRVKLRMRELVDQLQQIRKEYIFNKERELDFRQISETTNKYILWFSFLQIGILVAINTCLMKNSRTFTTAKKLLRRLLRQLFFWEKRRSIWTLHMKPPELNKCLSRPNNV